MTVRDVCARLGVGEATVLHWLHTGQLKGVNVARDPRAKKPRWRITESAVAAFEELRSAGPSPAARMPRRKRQGGVIEWY